MKRIIKLDSQLIMITFIGASALLNSCKRYLSPDPVSSFSQGYIFSNVPYAKSAVIGVYDNLSGQNSFGLYYSMYYPYDSDEMMGAGQNNQDGERRDLARYNVTPTNTGLAAAYNNMYSGIERANICIEQIPKMSLYTTGSPNVQGELKRLYGEALTLRAEFYLDLVRNWGDLPAPWIPSAEQPNLFLPKTDRDTIYDHLLKDLSIAEDLVPWR
ncbi:MAG TPA: RagB/SusD family nutrient uptake outer membrane protein, partial [Puia sp.]|nr:RagB/SusD family nutrient uptake outer membrane protein [Puia sp.]